MFFARRMRPGTWRTGSAMSAAMSVATSAAVATAALAAASVREAAAQAPAPAPEAAAPAPEAVPAPAPTTAPVPPASPSTSSTIPSPAPGSAPPPLPPADQASGIAVPEEAEAPSKALWIPRVVFFVPRWTFWTVAQPFRLGAWAYEKYSLRARLKGALFNVDETYGVYPVASYSTDFGIAGGLRFVHYDLFDHDEHLKLRANFGGRFQQAYGFTIDSGERLAGGMKLELEARYERRPSERFFGLGNGERADEPEDGMLIDPIADDRAIKTRFRETLVRVVTKGEVPLWRERGKGADGKKLEQPSSLKAYLSGALMLRSFGDHDEDGIQESYDVTKLPGFTEGVDNVYVEVELAYDSRRQPSFWQSKVLDATGWYAAAHLGRAVGVGDDPSAFTRYGGEVTRLFDLYRGSRVLALRLFLEAATAEGEGRGNRKLPFIDLPRMGGPEYLRGYPDARFRDRVVALGTVEYTWDLGNMLAAYTFVDVGRPAPELAKLDEGALRVGFGGGVQLHTQDSFITRTQIAGSRDGDIFFELVLSPAFGRRERAGRY